MTCELEQGRSQLLGIGGAKFKKNNLGGQNYKFFKEEG
jgi:hypothetical protein